MYIERPHRTARPWFGLAALLALTSAHCAHHVAPPAPPVHTVLVVSPPRPAAPPPPPPPAKIEEARAIPLSIMAGAFEPLHGDDPTLPDAVLAAAHGRTLAGAYKICITTAGNVHSVVPVVSIAGADNAVITTLKNWQFQKLPMQVCKVQTFSFEIP
jgi:hypothetical protein